MSEPLAPEDFPGPPGLPFLGNVRAIDMAQPIESLMSLAREYGPIFKLTTPGGISVVVSGVDLVSEICDDARFDKVITAGLSILAEGPVDAGLFTAHTDDPMWARAHGLLMAPFSMQAMRDYMPAMIDIADQLMGKWDRLNPGEEIDVPADMTRLTLDTIALCGFGYRFNSFYRETPHPFVQAMVRVLDEAQTRPRQLPIQTRLKISAQRQFEEDQAFMASLVDDLIRKRRAMGDAADNTDLLGRMITGVDKQTGLTLPDENIRAQCITFLVAGHETTSGLLSFAIYFLLEHPEYLDRAREEVDRVLGGTLQPTFDQLHELTYVRQVLDEALRLWPTAAGFRRHAREDTVIGGGRYAIPEDLGMMVLSPMLHRDKSIWGEDAEEFNPDHTTPERMSTIPPNAYKPFGTGQRACIGRQFALQEAVLVLGMLLQRFELIKDPNYRLHTKVTLTVKPADFYIQVRRRADRPIDKAEPVTLPPRQLRPSSGPAVEQCAPHAAGRVVRVEPRDGRGPCHSPCAGGNRARLRRDPGFPGRLRRAAAREGCDHRLLLLQRAAARQRRQVPPLGSTRRAQARLKTCRTPSSAAATPSGRRRTRRYRLNSMPGSNNMAPRASTHVAPATPRRLRCRVPQLARHAMAGHRHRPRRRCAARDG